MPSWIARLQDDMGRLWGQLTMGQKWLVGGVSSALLLGLLGISLTVYFLPAGDFLYGGLDDAEIGEVSKFLDEKGARYSIRDGSVYVYGDKDKLRAEFATVSRKKPLGGYNVLREYNWSQTSAQFRETKLRALQEELESTIERGSDLISWARVQLTERDQGLFPSGDTKATASVKIGTDGNEIPTESIQGIQWTVANSLPGLKPEDVVVTNENSMPLKGHSVKSDSELITSEKDKAEQAYSEKRMRAIADILNPIVAGSSNYTIATQVKLNYDRKTIKEKYIDSESPFARKRKTEEIEDKQTEKGGAPGTPSNNPDDTIGTGSSSSGTNSAMTQETTEVDNEPRLVRETNMEVAPGELEGQWISVAINYAPKLVDGKTVFEKRSPEQMAEIEGLLKQASAHIENSTRHYFALNQVQFDRSAAEIEESNVQWNSLRRNIESGVFLLAAFLSIMIFFLFLRKILSAPAAEEEVAMGEELAAAAPRAPEMTLRDLGLHAIGDTESLSPEAQKSKMIKEEIESYAKQNPQEFTGILRNWLAE